MTSRMILLAASTALLWAGPTLAQPPAPPAVKASPSVEAPPAEPGADPNANQSPGAAPAPYPRATPDEEAERLKIWNSPAMMRARAWLVERAQYSARIDSEDVQRQMAALQSMSATEMRAYLEKFNQQRAATRQGEAAAAAARNRAVNEALDRQQDTRQVFANYSVGRTQAADILRDRRAEQLESQRIADAFRASRSDRLMTVLAPVYNPFAPTFDPASPSHYKRAAAAATLPGDLPAGDPRNFAVDVVGVDGPGFGMVILKGGATVPNVGAGSASETESGASPGSEGPAAAD